LQSGNTGPVMPIAQIWDKRLFGRIYRLEHRSNLRIVGDRVAYGTYRFWRTWNGILERKTYWNVGVGTPIKGGGVSRRLTDRWGHEQRKED